MIPKNKKGAEKTISVYWFAILILVSGAIVYMVSIFYGVPYEVSQIEANILINVVADCLSEEGKLKEKVSEEEFKINFIKECHLNLEKGPDGRHYVWVSFSDFNTQEKIELNLVGGNINLKDSFENYFNPDQITSSKKSFYTKTQDGNKELIVETFVIVKKI
jgi:hypothetical protein